MLGTLDIPEAPLVSGSSPGTDIVIRAYDGTARISIANDASPRVLNISHIYILGLRDAAVRVSNDPVGYLPPVGSRPVQGWEEPFEAFRVGLNVGPIPPGALESFEVSLGVYETERRQPPGGWPILLRLHVADRSFNYAWRFDADGAIPSIDIASIM